MRFPRLLLIVSTFVLLLLPRVASAQFDTPNRSFHNSTAFRLDGRHQAVACESCHLNGQYKGTPSTCYDCHWVRRQDDRYRTRLGTQCEQCHRPTSWTAVRWDHAAQSGIPLNQDHRTIGCESCHRGASFQAASVSCVSCHQKDYAASRSPNHAAAGFPVACDTCHRPSESTWRNTGTGAFSHTAAFPLVGAHTTQTCAACHKNNVYKGTPTECVDCHRADYTRARAPDHAAAGFPLTCELCHRSTDLSFAGSGAATSFNHTAVYALVGLHATQTCTACHRNNVYKGTPRECIGCHQTQYTATRNPPHAAAGFGTTCDSCHRPTDTQWTGATFNHNATYALVGRHSAAACTACHVNNVHRGTARDCIGCHQSQYTATRNPPHAAAGFGTACDSCHRPTDAQWTGVNFNHNATFALVGRHAAAACTACHVNNVYKGTARDCVGCHQAQYTATRNPPHASSGFGTNCESCHRPQDSQWTGGSFNHNATFALVGRHAAAACSACHVNNVYKGTARDCVGCHQAQYTATRNPPHASAGFGTNCESCHRPQDSQWTGGSFNHNATFALVGRHASAACSACHVNNVYKGTARDCVGCHRAQYTATRNPPHASAGFGTSCDTCHKASDASWTSGSFNHNSTFQLVGKHASAACSSCHVNNVYKGTPRTCVGCHQSQYNATRNPNHASAGFGTNCDTCHKASDTSWTQGQFSHKFPLTGRHNVSCSQCHTTPNNYSVFSCTVCHTRSETDSEHKGRSGYVYDSRACYSCHPTGRS